MPETTPLIKAALNLRVGAGFDVYFPKENEMPTIETVKTGDSQELWKYVTVLGVTMGITIGILGWRRRRMK